MFEDDNDDIVLPEKLAIFKKGKEIFDLVRKITDLIPEDNEYLVDVKGCMLSDAAQLTVKVAGAEAACLYDLKMENAAKDGIIPAAAACMADLRREFEILARTIHEKRAAAKGA